MNYKRLGLVCLGLLLALPAGAQVLGLPSARNSMPVFSRYPSLLPFGAAVPAAGDCLLLPQLAVSQGMTSGFEEWPDGKLLRVFFDYESLSLELPFQFGLGKGWGLAGDLRFIRYGGGVFDEIIRNFHLLFGFPNNARDLLPYNQLYIQLDTDNGFNLDMTEEAWLLADPLLGLTYTPWSRDGLSLGLGSYLSFPLHAGGELAGSSMACLLWSLQLDWQALGWLGVHGAGAFILPFESFGTPGPLPMVELRLSLLADLRKAGASSADGSGMGLMPFAELHFQSSPITTGVMEDKLDFFAIPNTDLQFGLLLVGGRPGEFSGFGIQEDPITHNAADVGLNLVGAYRIGK